MRLTAAERWQPRAGFLAVLLVISSALPTPAAAGHRGASTSNLEHVGAIRYRGGADLEFQDRIVKNPRTGARRRVSYVYATSLSSYTGGRAAGMRIVEITNPRRPVLRSFLRCDTNQNDVQVLTRGSKTFAILGLDYGSRASDCFAQLRISPKETGLMVVDVTNVNVPKAVSYLPVSDGAHNTTLHPAGRYLYVSDSEIGRGENPSRVQIVDLANPRRPKLTGVVDLPSGPGSSHDITFNAAGTRAYTAALSHTVILDTANPARPGVAGVIIDPTINIHHQADPFESEGRTYLVVTDEIFGASGNGFCPGGGLHVYDVTDERAPVKVGVFQIPDVSFYPERRRCTSHVLRIYPRQRILTIAWYEAGLWVVDISNPRQFEAVGAADPGAFGGPVADTWSAKMHRGYIYTNDMNLGLDVFEYFGPASPMDVTEYVNAVPSRTAGTVDFSQPVVSRPLFCFQAASGLSDGDLWAVLGAGGPGGYTR